MSRSPFRKQSQQAGFTLVEMLVYLAIFTMVSTASVLFLFSLTDFVSQYRIETALYRSGTNVMEQVMVGLRQADTIDLLNTTLNDPLLGELTVGHDASTTAFAISAGALELTVDGVPLENMLSSGVTAQGFTITHYPLAVGELVRVKLELTAAINGVSKSIILYDAAVIRGSL